MKKHTKVYLKQMGYDDTDFIECEATGGKAVDIHHIRGRGRGGKDTLCNLMALTREAHQSMGDNKHWKEYLLSAHFKMILKRVNNGLIEPWQHIFDSAHDGCEESKEFMKRNPGKFESYWWDWAQKQKAA